jgi:hypothetical protein
MSKPADWNDAYVWPQPDAPAEEDEAQHYEVTGIQAVSDDHLVPHQPGETFTGVIAPTRRSLLIAGGHLRLVVPETLEDLRAKARELEIPGRSKMSTEELKQAIAEAQAGQAGTSAGPSADPAVQADPADQADTVVMNDSVLAQDQPQEG